jgi:uncharacterized membrane protein YcaP (DUF421 family)
MDVQELLLTAGRAAAVYGLMLVVVRLLGKRTVGNFTAFDLLVALMLGEVVDEMIYGDVPFLQGTVAILVIGALAYLNSWLSYFGHGFDRALEGEPTVVIRDGKIDQHGMRAERMNEGDVLSELRLHGTDDISRVREARVETDGEFSVLLKEEAEPLKRRDLDRVEKALWKRLQRQRRRRAATAKA